MIHNSPKSLSIHITYNNLYFSECVAGLTEGLRSLGHPVTFSESAPRTKIDVQLVIGVNLFPRLSKRNCRLLAGIQTEQLPFWSTASNTGRIKRNLNRFKSVKGQYEIIYEWNPSLFAAGVGGDRFLPYGCPRRVFTKTKKEYDIAFIGNVHCSTRRQLLLKEISDNFSLFPDFSPGFGCKKEEVVRASRVLLNIHHYESCGMEAPRMFDYLSLGACVLSEWSPNTYPFQPQIDFEDFKNRQELFSKLTLLLKNDYLRDSIAHSGQKKSQTFTYNHVSGILSLDLLHCIQQRRNIFLKKVRSLDSLFRSSCFDSIDLLSKIKRRLFRERTEQ